MTDAPVNPNYSARITSTGKLMNEINVLTRENERLNTDLAAWVHRQAELQAEIEQLRAWQTEATPLLAAINEQLASDARLGESFVSDVLPRVIRERNELRTENERLNAALDMVAAEREAWKAKAEQLQAENEQLRAEKYGPLDNMITARNALASRVQHTEAENERLNSIFDELHDSNDHLETQVKQLQIGLKAALDAIDWMFAAQQPLRDPWFTYRDTLIASARHALEQTQPHD